MPRVPLGALVSLGLATSLSCAAPPGRPLASGTLVAPTSLHAPTSPRIAGAWRLVETATRVPGAEWDRRPAPQGGLYVFAERHYSYFYVRTPGPRPRFADANQPTEAERAATLGTFIAGAGTYTFDGQTLSLGTEFRKNPNEMGEGRLWRWRLERTAGDTAVFIFADPPFQPGREQRTVLVRVE